MDYGTQLWLGEWFLGGIAAFVIVGAILLLRKLPAISSTTKAVKRKEWEEKLAQMQQELDQAMKQVDRYANPLQDEFPGAFLLDFGKLKRHQELRDGCSRTIKKISRKAPPDMKETLLALAENLSAMKIQGLKQSYYQVWEMDQKMGAITEVPLGELA